MVYFNISVSCVYRNAVQLSVRDLDTFHEDYLEQ